MTWTESAIAEALHGKFYTVPNGDNIQARDNRPRVLTTAQRSIITAMYAARSSHREMAAAAGLPIGAVGRHIKRMRRAGELPAR